MNNDATALVLEFCLAFGKGTPPSELVEFFSDDAVYHNMPMEPAAGKPAIRALPSEMLVAMSGLRAEVHRQLSDGKIVMHERTDYFSLGTQEMALPICGVFEIDDGRIANWREYFDLAMASGLAEPGE